MTAQSGNYYLATPPGGKGPGVLVLHPWWGLNDFMRTFCDWLAKEGFVVVAPDMFGGTINQTIDEAEKYVSALDWGAEVPPRILPAVEALKERAADPTKMAIVGFSFGAFWALWLAQRQPEWIQAVTLFYGTNGGEGNFQPSHAAFMGHYAENDPNEPDEVVQALEKLLKEAGRPTAFYTYPGAGHWFFETDRTDAYNPMAAELAWERTISFIKGALA
jgi:carboxymethylenebutenolidase